MMRYKMIPAVLGLLLTSTACTRAADVTATIPDPAVDLKPATDATSAEVVLAGGCFWCTEAVLERVPGVSDVVSGYAGGTDSDANYEQVSAGRTAHAEVIKVTYNPQQVSFGRILKVFFAAAHDPTQVNRQGPDVGKQYRSAIFYADDEQKRVAEAYIAQLNESKIFGKPIATTLEKLDRFYPAEDYHQDYVKNHPENPYVQQNVPPKLAKLKKLQEQAKK
jgi:peptide-methionine (S)-S-oxide reductase